ncbi:MAG: transposase [Candidatus Nealsonbacteria bacterium]|nr:transposase [Candidatus Nealsonbacteria bacterium]
MNILKQKAVFFQEVSYFAQKQTKKLFSFGLEAFALKSIRSLRSNARLSSFSWCAAKMKTCRLTCNAKIPKIFPRILKHLNIANCGDIVAVDFSDFGNGILALMFARQTRKGRAVPLYFETYIPRKDFQNTFVIQTIERFANILGFKPYLVFDRGFACPDIIRFLNENSFKFIIRTKKIKQFSLTGNGAKFKAKDASGNDLPASAYDCNLRLIVSDPDGKNEEPWYLATNDFESSREAIIDNYYHRFEIEEFFRDAKRLLGLENLHLKKPLSLEIILWFVILSTWFLWTLETQMDSADKKLKSSMRLSVIRYCLEALWRQAELNANQIVIEQFCPNQLKFSFYEKV